jgi:hypothetical protein
MIVLLWLSSSTVLAQEKNHEWFPKNSVFPLLEYDLLEVQPYAGILFLNSNTIENNAAYIPVNLGFRKSFFQWNMGDIRFDLAMGAASYTQFEIIRFDESTLRGGLLNTDFKASGFLNMVKDEHAFRFQIFHVSSHLGDDYILRNQDFTLNDKSVNYEQIDLTYLYKFTTTEVYIGLGYVITPNAFRDRFMAELGVQGNIPLKPKVDFTLGTDIKIYEENDFVPDIHGGLGFTFKQRDTQQISLLLDFYFGNIPYSTLDFGKVFWIGPSCRVYL